MQTTACSGRGTSLVVLAEEHALWLCEEGRAHRSFDVRLASGGVGKQREGDQKLPLGTYAVGRPRSSKKFGLFIPVEYPTEAQARRGFTGGSIGVHGPHRAIKWLGRLTNAFDTTDGCIGLATDEDIAEVSRFVRDRHVARIHVLSTSNPPAAPSQ